MRKQELLTYGLILTSGFIAGWFAHSSLSPTAIVKAPTKQVANQAQAPSNERASSTGSMSNISSRHEEKVKNDVNSDVEVNSDETDLVNDLAVSNFDELFALLENGSEQDMLNQFDSIMQLFADSDFTELLLDSYLNSGDPQFKGRLRRLVSDAMWRSQHQAELEIAIMSRLKGGNNQSQWLDLLSEIGVIQEESVDYIATQIPQLYEERDIASAIVALSKRPSLFEGLMNRELHEKIKSQISNYVDSTNPELRKAVLTSLHNFSRDDSETLLLNAMNDSSVDVREAATMTAMSANFQSEALKNKLLSLMLDESQSRFVRSRSYAALNFYNLENENYDTVRQFGEYLKELYPEN